MATALICDDDPVARRLASAVLAAHDIDVVAEVDVATDALQVAAMTRPTLVVIDVSLPGLTGIEAVPLLLQASPASAVIVFTAFDSARSEALAAGATAVADKADVAQLESAVTAVLAATAA